MPHTPALPPARERKRARRGRARHRGGRAVPDGVEEKANPGWLHCAPGPEGVPEEASPCGMRRAIRWFPGVCGASKMQSDGLRQIAFSRNARHFSLGFGHRYFFPECEVRFIVIFLWRLLSFRAIASAHHTPICETVVLETSPVSLRRQHSPYPLTIPNPA